MTEAEWLGCNDPTPMLEYLRGQTSDRKLRLFAMNCAVFLSKALVQIEFSEAVDTLEGFLEGEFSAKEYENAKLLLGKPFSDGVAICGPIGEALFADDAWEAANATVSAVVSRYDLNFEDPNFPDDYDPEVRCLEIRAMLARILRENFCNPFRPLTPDRTWLTATVVSLAEAIYAERAFDRMPILADALEDAGCTNRDILDHCRSGTEHVRGCWVVDLLLGKS